MRTPEGKTVLTTGDLLVLHSFIEGQRRQIEYLQERVAELLDRVQALEAEPGPDEFLWKATPHITRLLGQSRAGA